MKDKQKGIFSVNADLANQGWLGNFAFRVNPVPGLFGYPSASTLAIYFTVVGAGVTPNFFNTRSEISYFVFLANKTISPDGVCGFRIKS
jgi:hypothetical protein